MKASAAAGEVSCEVATRSVATTDDFAKRYAAEMTEAGIRAVLAKPFSPREVLQKVEELMGVGREAVAQNNEQ